MKIILRKQSLLPFGWLLLATPVAVQAQFTYTTNNGTITITKYTGTNSAVVIPDTITGLPVTSIGIEAFYNSSITSVTIPNSVTSIGDNAFGFTGLTSITIPNSVTNLGSAFYDCTSLTNVTIPNSVTSIGDGTFFNCTSLTNVTIPNGVTSIGVSAFLFSASLTSVLVTIS